MTSPIHPLLESVATLPLRPGVYRFLDDSGRVLYVGKAKSLKKRVVSYFSGAHNSRIQAMLNQARQLEITVTSTENEALILEANLIKRFHPPYNVLLKDDKSHPYLYLSTEHPFPRIVLIRGTRQDKGRFFGPFPSVTAVRKTLKWLQQFFLIRDCEDSQFNQQTRPCLNYQIKRCSAPCCDRITPQGYAERVAEMILFLEGKEKILLDLLKQSMWQAAENRAFEEAAQQRDRIKAITLVQDQRRVNLSEAIHLDVFGIAQDGSGFCVQVFFVRHGINLGNNTFFPENSRGFSAEEILESFVSQFYIRKNGPPIEVKDPSGIGHPPEEILVSLVLKQRRWLAEALSSLHGGKVRLYKPAHGEKQRLMQMALLNAEQALERRSRSRATFNRLLHELATLLHLSFPLKRIEVYDVSHFQDSHPVGSLIVFGPEGFRKQSYRHFNLQDPELRDDTARMARMLFRRLSHLGEESNQPEGTWPDLILLDGGRGQLNAVLQVVDDLGLPNLKFCAIAKGEDRHAGGEHLFLPDWQLPIILPSNAPVLFLLQNIRDEAHRFAIGHHRTQRSRAQTRSILDQIPGVGPQKKRVLLRHFGSMQAVREATFADLRVVAGVSEGLAHQIIQFFRENP